MPKPQRTPEEIEQAKTDILEKAVQLIVEIGYQDFTMRKLAQKLKITATTIYNYYKNKDDLFINLLIMGFEELVQGLEEARQSRQTPPKQLRAMIGAYTDFGLTNANVYNLMYTWHVPKYNNYAGTPLEPVARRQLDIALKVPGMFSGTIRDYARSLNKIIPDEEIRFLLIHYWSQLHGFIAGCNNTILSYIHSAPMEVKEKHLNLIAEKFGNDLSRLCTQGD